MADLRTWYFLLAIVLFAEFFYSTVEFINAPMPFLVTLIMAVGLLTFSMDLLKPNVLVNLAAIICTILVTITAAVILWPYQSEAVLVVIKDWYAFWQLLFALWGIIASVLLMMGFGVALFKKITN